MHMAMALAREGGREGEGGGGNGGGERRVHMFEKVVTPSDVGKLNRLVVPKHFAEKYFPLGPAAAGPAGTMLCFEDACGGGRLWRFRYSYWSSSQSYVMTKGWSRFVREKRLAAGDTVSFCRAGTRLFIDWRPRARAAAMAAPTAPPRAHAGRLRLFGVDVELHGEAAPVLLDLQL